MDSGSDARPRRVRAEVFLAAARRGRAVSCIGGRAARDGSYQLFLDERAVCGYATDVATGLAYLHGAGIVHGDVKSRNIVIGADGRAKLTDFGCSRKAGAAADVPIIGGTPAFMAPEVARGEDQGPAADVWALGCTVVEAVRRGAAWTATHSPRCT